METRAPFSRRRLLLAGFMLGVTGVEGWRWATALPADAAVDPNLQQQIDTLYALRDEEDVRAVRPPFSPLRLAFYQAEDPEQARSIPAGPDAIYFRWEDGRAKRWGMTFGGGGADFPTLMEMFLKIYPQEIEGDPVLLKKKLPGDFVFRTGARPERVAAQVQRILREQYEMPARVEFREVERKVLVARGKYQARPLPDRRENQIEIYGRELTDPQRGGGGSGTLSECLGWVGMFIRRRVVPEIPDADQIQVSWHYNERLTSEKERAEDRNEAGVLRHFTEQTGITLAEETRKVRVLFLEKT